MTIKQVSADFALDASAHLLAALATAARSAMTTAGTCRWSIANASANDSAAGANALAAGVAAGWRALETPMKALHGTALTGMAVPTGPEYALWLRCEQATYNHTGSHRDHGRMR